MTILSTGMYGPLELAEGNWIATGGLAATFSVGTPPAPMLMLCSALSPLVAIKASVLSGETAAAVGAIGATAEPGSVSVSVPAVPGEPCVSA